MSDAPPDRRSGKDDADPSRRSATHRDRDRILYSEAFRRLGGVTQVALGTPEMTLHNRLTHSLKVEQVGQSLFSKLDSDMSLDGLADHWAIAAACLGHDLGHPPFGHAGEEELNALVTCPEHRTTPRPVEERGRDRCTVCYLEDGFEGNAQSFRILSALAVHKDSYKHRPPLGLDLTTATLRAVTKYPWGRGDNPGKPKKWGAYDPDLTLLNDLAHGDKNQTLDAQIMDWADDISYATHDIEDFYRAGRIPLGDYRPDSDALRDFLAYATAPDAAGAASDEVLESLMNLLDFVPTSRYSGSDEDLATLDKTRGVLITGFIDAAKVEEGQLVIDSTQVQLNAIVKQLIWYHVIEGPELSNIQLGQRRVLREIFQILEDPAKNAYKVQGSGDPDLHELRRLPSGLRHSTEIAMNQDGSPYSKTQRVYRGLLDYIAGLSDADAYAVHRVLKGGEDAGHL